GPPTIPALPPHFSWLLVEGVALTRPRRMYRPPQSNKPHARHLPAVITLPLDTCPRKPKCLGIEVARSNSLGGTSGRGTTGPPFSCSFPLKGWHHDGRMKRFSCGSKEQQLLRPLGPVKRRKTVSWWTERSHVHNLLHRHWHHNDTQDSEAAPSDTLGKTEPPRNASGSTLRVRAASDSRGNTPLQGGPGAAESTRGTATTTRTAGSAMPARQHGTGAGLGARTAGSSRPPGAGGATASSRRKAPATRSWARAGERERERERATGAGRGEGDGRRRRGRGWPIKRAPRGAASLIKPGRPANGPHAAAGGGPSPRPRGTSWSRQVLGRIPYTRPG
ncbi:unnamed protein product, partial [Prorocentrum cordatum]